MNIKSSLSSFELNDNRVEAAFLNPSKRQAGQHSGSEPCLGGKLREKAVWVEEWDCVGCRYCAHVACNTFVIVPETGRCRAIRQDGNTAERIQEAIDTCPVDCIHWVDFHELTELQERQLDSAQNRGIPQKQITKEKSKQKNLKSER